MLLFNSNYLVKYTRIFLGVVSNYIIIIGTILAMILTTPSWGIFNQNKLNWKEHKPENKVDSLKAN